MPTLTLYRAGFTAGREVSGIGWSFREFPGLILTYDDLTMMDLGESQPCEVETPEGAALIEHDGMSLCAWTDPTTGRTQRSTAARVAELAAAARCGFRFVETTPTARETMP